MGVIDVSELFSNPEEFKKFKRLEDLKEFFNLFCQISKEQREQILTEVSMIDLHYEWEELMNLGTRTSRSFENLHLP